MAEAETVLTTWLRSAFPAARVVTETPSDLDELVAAGTPIIAVARIAGTEEWVSTFDNPILDFDCYAATRPEARTLAYSVRDSLRRDLPGQTVAGAAVTRVAGFSGPIHTHYVNTNVRRFSYTALVRIHSLEV